MSPIQTILALWQPSSSSSPSITHDTIDVEAQTTRGTQTPLPLPTPTVASPSPTHSHTPRLSDPIDDFFGVTHDSRHDLRLTPTSVSSTASVSSDLPPPPYYNPLQRQHSTDLPAYTESQSDPITLAQYLFKFGFVFPPFWLFGALILLSPLTAPADFHPTKPESERQELVLLMRRAELRWAKRCAWALLGLAVVLAGVVGCVVGISKGKVGL